MLPSSDVSYCWTNDPSYLRVQIYFNDGSDNNQEDLEREIQNPQRIPDLQPQRPAACISSMVAIRKYYLWNDTSDGVAMIDESDRQKILKDIGEHGVDGPQIQDIEISDKASLDELGGWWVIRDLYTWGRVELTNIAQTQN